MLFSKADLALELTHLRAMSGRTRAVILGALLSVVLIACGGGGGTDTAPAPTPAAATPPATPTGLTVAYSAKQYTFSWDPSAGADYYQLAEDPDGAGSQAEVAMGGNFNATNYSHILSILLHKRLNAQYRVRACNSVGCSSYSAALVPSLTQAIGYFKASRITPQGNFFGRSVALSADGRTLAVGASEESNLGAVYVFIRDGGVWRQQARLSAVPAGDRFGWSVALSADGNTLAVGSRGDASGSTGLNSVPAINGAFDSGAVFVFSRTNGAWVQQAYVKASNTGAQNHFGESVALSADGDTLAVGASGEGSSATGVGGDQTNSSAPSNSFAASGAVYIFSRSGAVWTQQAYIKASNSRGLLLFGLSVALSADGNTLAVGGPSDSSGARGVGGSQVQNPSVANGSGAVYVFNRSGTTWSQVAFVKASNTGAGDFFGEIVALSADGSTLAVAAYREDSNATGVGGDQENNGAIDSGAVYVFIRSGSTWVQQAYIKASNTEALDNFGTSLALSADGSVLAVGAPEESSNAVGVNGNQTNNNAPRSGAAYLFARKNGAWSQQAYLKASNTDAVDVFGRSVALAANGETLAVGSVIEDSNATGVGGDQANNNAVSSGAVYLY